MALRTCPEGHRYQKTSDCPTCPICEMLSKEKDGFMKKLSAPSQRALKAAGITTLQELASKTRKELLALHGFGPSSIRILEPVLKENGLDFAVEKQA